jgi:hypothetical protein
MRKADLAGKAVGLIAFCAGVALLGVVAALAYKFFTTPADFAAHKPGIPAPSISAQLGGAFVKMLLQIGLLLVMAIAGSLISARGIQLYAASAHSDVYSEASDGQSK